MNYMINSRFAKKKVEYGDFQTPYDLALKICKTLSLEGVKPNSILEPTCGTGNFLMASIDTFVDCSCFKGFDIKKSYIDGIKETVKMHNNYKNIYLNTGDFFEINWDYELENMPEPILIVGNPPWVTNSQLGALGSKNIPIKSNFQNMKGFDALTGKSNFDISEWMIIKMMEWIEKRKATVAMLCKTSVARKILEYAWKSDRKIGSEKIYRIDSKKHFEISADACLLIIQSAETSSNKTCDIYDDLSFNKKTQVIGYRDGFLISSIQDYENTKYLLDKKGNCKWRTGIKHDLSKIMEIVKVGEDKYKNGLGEEFYLEKDYLYPLMKGSDISNGIKPRKWLIVTQKSVNDDVNEIKKTSPKTWEYLIKYKKLFDDRASSIYKNRPPFSIFGVGDYTFSEWKIAIPALYKKCEFSLIGKYENKPIVFDDTVNFLPVKDKKDAEFLLNSLNSKLAVDFYKSFIFFDSKRPITIQLLKYLDIAKLTTNLKIKADNYAVKVPNLCIINK